MRNLKRALSLALASVMLLGMMVVGTGASYADVTSKNNQEAIEVMQAIGVMTGDTNGNFNPDQKVTRGEMAVVMTNMLGLNVNDYASTTLTFTDVPDWGKGFVAACLANGIAAGYNDKQFGFNDSVTTAQAALMMMKALGYFQYASDFGGDWQLATVKQGSKIELFEGIEAGTTVAMTRNDVAQIALNTLQSTVVDSEGSDGISIGDVTIGSTIKYVEQKTSKYDYTKADGEADAENTLQLCEQLYKTELTKTTGSDDMLRTGTKWTYKGDEVGVYADEADYTVVLDKDYSTEAADADDFLAVLQDLTGNDDLSLYKVGPTDDVKLYINGKDYSGEDYSAHAKAGTVVELFCDDDVIKTVVGYNYTLRQITDVDTDVTDKDAKDGVTAYVDIDNVDTAIKNTKIPGYDAKTYVKDAYVAVVVDEDDNKTIIDSYIPTTVKGSVTTKNATNLTVTVDGTKYTAAGTYTAGAMSVAVSAVAVGSDNTYKLYLDNNGYVIGIEKVEGADPTINDVYYVSLVWKNDNSGDYGTPKTTYHAQLVALDGTVKEVELEKDEHSLPSDKNDLSNGSDYANYNALTGLLVTLSDEDGSNSEADDEKFNMTEWGTNDDWFVKDASSASAFTKDMTRLTVGETYRFDKNTQYVMAGQSGSDLKVSVATGGIAYTVSSDKVYFITEKNSALVKFVIIGSADKIEQNTEYGEDLVYVIKNSGDEGDGYMVQEVYFADGVKKSINIKGTSAKAVGFYTYAINDDGIYELKDVTEATSDITAAVWEDTAHVFEGVKFDSMYGTLLTVKDSDSHKLEDIKTSGAKFVDAHDTDAAGQYTKTVSSLSALADLVENSEVGAVTLSMNVTKDGAVIIIVTDIAAA